MATSIQSKSPPLPCFHTVVIGAGIFGVEAAIAEVKNGPTLIIDEATRIGSGATTHNQMRVHSGLHYPRAASTAMECQVAMGRFCHLYESAIVKHVKHYYAIDSLSSLTASDGFQRFADFIGTPLAEVSAKDTPWLNRDRLSKVYAVNEPVIDPTQVVSRMKQRLEKTRTQVLLGHSVSAIQLSGDHWELTIESQGHAQKVLALRIINATYRNLNTVQEMAGLPRLAARHELAELAAVHCPEMMGRALTVIDGPFVSLTPFGESRLHLLSSVLYTHHSSDGGVSQSMLCQHQRPDCTPSRYQDCGTCYAKPPSRFGWMRRQAERYVPAVRNVVHHSGLWHVKTLWSPDASRDERRTEVWTAHRDPDFIVLLSGKLTSAVLLEEKLGRL